MRHQKRLDKILIDRGLVRSREKARGLILAGKVIVDGRRIDKAGTLILEGSAIEIIEEDIPYVSRGGVKLEKGLAEFNIRLEGKNAIDVGASTGGFTDCLLKNGISRVYAVDVGYGQLAWELRNDPRVIVIERKNIRHLIPSDIGERLDLAVIDVSFISLKLVLPVVNDFLKRDGEIIALIKPQFEVGKGEVGKGGVVRDTNKHQEVVSGISLFAKGIGLTTLGMTKSPILGPKGNVEFLIYLGKRGGP